MKKFSKIIAIFLAALMAVSGLAVTVLAEPEDTPAEAPVEDPAPELEPSEAPTESETSEEPSDDPTVEPSDDPTVEPSDDPAVESSDDPAVSSDLSSDDSSEPVVDPEPTVEYTVDVWVGANGSVVANGREIAGGRGFGFTVDAGGSVEIAITPNDGYELDSVEVNGAKIEVSGNAYTLSDVSANTEINITFKEYVPVITDYEVVLEAEGNGTISAGDKSATNGKTDAFLVNKDNGITITVSADEGYELKSLTVNGNSVEVTNGTYVLKNLTENVTVKAVFREFTYDVTFELIGKGSVEIRETHGGALIGTLSSNGSETVSKTFAIKGIAIKFFMTNDGICQVFCQEPNRVYNEDTKTFYISPISMDSKITIEFKESSNDPVDPPVDDPVDPPVDDPVDPPVDDPVKPPVDNPGGSSVYTLTFAVEMGGTVTFGDGVISAVDSFTEATRIVTAGETKALVITPSEGFEFEFLRIDGTDVEITDNTYTFESISANMSVEIGFKKLSDPTDNVITSDEVDWEQETVTIDTTDKVIDKSVFDYIATLEGADKYVVFTTANGSFHVPYGKALQMEGDSVQISLVPLTDGDDYSGLLAKYGDDAAAFKAYALSANLPEGTLVSFNLDNLAEGSKLYVYVSSVLGEKADLTVENGKTLPVPYSGESILVIAANGGAEQPPEDGNDESGDESVVVVVSDDETEDEVVDDTSEDSEGGSGTVIVIIIIVLVAILGAAALFIVKWRQEKF